MNLKKLLIGFGFVGGALALTRLLFAKPASTTRFSNNSYDAIEAYIERQMHRFNIPGVSLAIIEGEKTVHYRGFGRARPGGEVPTPQTPFFIGSLTKSITALAVMQLVEAGKLELDAPVQRYLPWFRVADPQASAQITVRHLLNHTSGLSIVQGQMILAEMDDSPDATERQLRALSRLELSHPVGTKFQYNNTNYNLLGLIIEAAIGESYSDYIQQHIFDPLDMRHSYTSKSEAQKNGLAMGHRYWFGFPIPEPNLLIPLGSLPSGQLISCAEDMAHYLIAQLNGGCYGDVQILSSTCIDEMQHGTAEIIEMGFPLGSYGMGWESQVSGKSTIVWHSGIVPDFGAIAALVLEQNKGIVLLFNVNHAITKLTFDEFGMGAAQRLAGEVPSKTFFGIAPWLMHGMMLIPLLQIIEVITTLRQVNRLRSDSGSHLTRGRLWCQHILLPLIPNILVALTLVTILGKMRGWIKLFMPDFSWIARICGSFAAMWAFLRTGLVLRALHKSQPKSSLLEDIHL